MEKIPEFIRTSSINVNETYSYINNTGFYALANPIYFNYYYRFARRYAWWYDGWCPDFHSGENGIFSTNLAHALVDGIANHIIGKKILLQSGGKNIDSAITTKILKEAYKWADSVNLTQVYRAATKYSEALGTSLLKLNVSRGGLWVEALRFDNFFFETDFKGEIQNVTCLINSYADTNATPSGKMEKYGDEVSQRLDNKFYLVEKRYFKSVKEIVDGKYITHPVPYVTYQVHKYNGNIINAQSWDLSLRENYNWESVPSNVRKAIHRDYAVVEIGKEQRLPFNEELGVELIRYNGSDGSLPQQPFGESVLKNIIADLMDYDYSFSCAFRDMYVGKGQVFVAKELQTALSGQTAYNGLDETIYTPVPTLDGKLGIDKVQFDLRVNEWRDKINSIYERIATKIGISPSSIASYLTDNTARTAKEVSTETTDTDNYIDIQRGCLTPAFNRILKCVGNFYGWQEEIEVKFAKGGSQNIDTIIDRMIKLVQAGLIHPKNALREIMVDADEWEVEEAWKKIEEYQGEQQQQQADMFGNLDFLDNGH